MLTLQETLSSQNNLYQICSERQFPIYEIFSGNIFYGHDYILKKYVNLPATYALKAVVPHGPYLTDTIWEAEIHSPLPVIFAYPPYHEQTYIQLNQKYAANKVIIPSASPFLYLLELLKQHPQSKRKGTIFFPAHSTHHVTVQFDWESIAEYLNNLSEEYQPVTVCMYWRDFELGRHLPFLRRGMKIVSAGHMFDKDFLFRFYHLCSTHIYAASNDIGSNLFFSIKSGCSYFYIDLSNCFYNAKSDDILKRDVSTTPVERLDVLKSLFQNPQTYTTSEQMQVVDYYLGAKYLKSPEELHEQVFYAEELFKKSSNNRQIIQASYNSHKLLPKILIDCICFQFSPNGISLIWKSLFQEWLNNGFAQYIILIDRGETAPKLPGIRYVSLPYYDYHNAEQDQELIQQVCDTEEIDVFISTYYTIPTKTTSVFIAYDMLPELMEWDLNHPMWKAKHHAIENSTAYLSFSQNTAKDLVRFFPDISLKTVTIVAIGIDHQNFSVATLDKINTFQSKYSISKPYFLVVAGDRGYQNSILFFQSFAQLASKKGFDVVCIGSDSTLSSDLRTCTSGSLVHILQLNEEELATAYSAAMALVYTSNYESFRLPVLEAMACGCPVITSNNPAIIELTGEAAIYVNDNDVDSMINALCDVQKPNIRSSLISAGLKQVKCFFLSEMANEVSSALIDATLLHLNLREINYIIFPDWSQAEERICLELQRVIKTLALHHDSERITLLINTNNIEINDANILVSSILMNLMIEEELDIEKLEISMLEDLSKIQWQALSPYICARIILEIENKVAIAKFISEVITFCELNNI
ncbi:glycosyltransferase family 1 protein [Anabaena cylindrica UHCC 0172]|uniref:glycosyltransferase family 4 protein n=1 Tax=Anabaena cylindrica TaxID=1165 RepID=UPI002B20A70B|nr:glycosyltransferase family 1 protein [Anabaena cylindrica]MEA5549895.1 glycosyltransferase family 1 protein [Anabaena cylindrica UHCC 0172]